MDPITAAFNTATAALTLLTKMFDAMTPEQRQPFLQPLADAQKNWNAFVNLVASWHPKV